MGDDAVTPVVPEGVGRTALGVARIRAAETERADRLFVDPWAKSFAAAGPQPEARAIASVREELFWQSIELSVVVRTRWLDGVMRDALDAGIRQVVLLGAGLDCRAYRLVWPDKARVFELDQEPVLAFKEHVLADAEPACERVAIVCDLLGPWTQALTAAGFDPDEPALWIAEGLFVYFELADNERLVASVRELSAPGSRLAITLSASGGVDPAAKDRVAERLTSMWRSGGAVDPATWLGRFGWDARTRNIWEVGAEYGRGLPGGGVPPRPSWLVLATRQDADGAPDAVE
jgi:methyltransferase (TIGR00027 family)